MLIYGTVFNSTKLEKEEFEFAMDSFSWWWRNDPITIANQYLRKQLSDKS